MADPITGWPPPYAAADASPESASSTGRMMLPDREQLDYFIKAGTAALLLLALPWLLLKLVTDPGAVIRGAGRHHLS